VTDRTRSELLDCIARTPSATRRGARVRAALSHLLAAVWMLGIFSTANAAAEGPPSSASQLAASVLGLSLLAAAVSAFVLGRAASPLGRSSPALALATTLVPCTALVWIVTWHAEHVGAHAPFGFRCLALTVVLGSALLLAQLFSRRRSDPVHPAWHGAALGAVASAWAAALVAAWCPFGELGHAFWGHTVPMLVLIAAGSLAGSRVLAMPRVEPARMSGPHASVP